MVSLHTISFVALLTIFNSFVICKEEKILSRKRRYLTFPEESTLQLIYDQIIGVVDYTNLFILGITCTMAWQLPHEPYDENFLRDQFLNDGEEEPKRKIDENISDRPVIEDVNQNYNSLDINSWNELFKQSNVSYSAPWDDNTRKKFSYQNTGTPRKATKKHIRYSAVGKRSIPATNKFDRFYSNHHRTTRHVLYKKIEIFLNARGVNGPECLRKALCETKKRQSDQTPGNLVTEIMRVIFSLPRPNEDTKYLSVNERDYDVAHDANFNCTDVYPKCKDSIWNDDFI